MHTKIHTVVRVSEEVRKEPSTEERLRFVEDELTKMRQTLAEMAQTLGKLVEKSAEWSPRGEPLQTKISDPLARSGVEPEKTESV